MARKRRRSGGGGGVRSIGGGIWGGPLMQIMGAVVLVICMIVFGLTIQSLDTGITSAAAYSWATGLASTMGVFGMVFWLVFVGAGLAAVGGGAYVNIKKGMAMGGVGGTAMLVVFGGVSILIMMIVNNLALAQLNTSIGVVNSTTNYATYFTGVVSIMGVFGLVIFVTLAGSSLSQFAAAFYTGFKSVKSLF